MFSRNIEFKGFQKIKKKSKVNFIWNKLKKNYLNNLEPTLLSLRENYKYSYNLRQIKKFKKFDNFRIFGMGGSILGAEAIHSFFKKKIKKKFEFVNNFDFKNDKKTKISRLNIVISKSGNTLETIVNFNLDNLKKNTLFITENKKNYLTHIAHKMKSEIVEHRNFIGGRYSVLSETGMLPASLMGLNPQKFKQFDNLIRKRGFIEKLISNVDSILYFYEKKKFNSIIINYDENSNDLFSWYQQLVAESLGKKGKGILPIVSNMPKDNHSMMQLYLDGNKNNFFTIFFNEDNEIKNVKKNDILRSHSFLKNKSLNEIMFAQFKATQNIFKKKNIPFRSFIVKKREEKTLGELFTFFILETILLGRALKLNPYDQPAVELIKKETIKILRNN